MNLVTGYDAPTSACFGYKFRAFGVSVCRRVDILPGGAVSVPVLANLLTGRK